MQVAQSEIQNSNSFVCEFREKGFVRMRNVLSSSDLRRLGQVMTNAIVTLENSPNGYNVTAAADLFWGTAAGAKANERSLQHDLDSLANAVRASKSPRLVDASKPCQRRGRFLLDTSVWRRSIPLADFALRGILPQIASELLETPSVRFYDDQIFVKEGGAVDRAAFHQDASYFHIDREVGCVFWIPLDTVREGGGRMGYIPGSHKWNEIYKPNIFVSEMPFPGSAGVDMPNINADPESHGVEYLDANPGDVLVHHFLTVHGSEGNCASTRRRAFSLRYCDGATRYRYRPGAPGQPLHKFGMRDGDLLDERTHPEVWPSSSS